MFSFRRRYRPGPEKVNGINTDEVYDRDKVGMDADRDAAVDDIAAI